MCYKIYNYFSLSLHFGIICKTSIYQITSYKNVSMKKDREKICSKLNGKCIKKNKIKDFEIE